MTIGQLATANASLTSGGANTFTVGDFTTTDGTALTSSEAVLVRSVVHGNDIDINRVGDPDADSTFEINVTVQSRTGAGERTDSAHVVTDVAGIEISETSSNAQEVTLVGERVDSSKVFVEQTTGLSNGSELTRTTGAHGQEETVLEAVRSAASDLDRRHDPNDDGTFELDHNVTSFTGGGVLSTALLMKDESGRTNAEMETAVVNTSGSTGDFMLLGTIGIEGV